jgi:hypothetical protein
MASIGTKVRCSSRVETDMKRQAFIPAAFLALALGGVASTTLASVTGASARSVPGPGEPTLAEVRAATERFRDVKIALAEGYIRDPGDMCDTAEMMGRPASQGAMGIHFFRPDLLGITRPPSPRVDGTGTHTDFRQPSILIYEPQKDGSLALVAVENLVFARAWRESGHSAPPAFHGVAYDSMVDDPRTAIDEAHMFEPHFDRHVWIYRDNPNGVFAQFNPMVTCEHHQTPKTHPHQTP